jgi:RecB family exonuclease
MGHVKDISNHLLAFQEIWTANGDILTVEVKGLYGVPGTAFNISAKADRIDRAHDGSLVVIDYKSGTMPAKNEIYAYDRQLLIEAVMAEAGVFDNVPPAEVSDMVHVGIGRKPQLASIDTEKIDLASVPGELASLLLRYASATQGYASRRFMEKSNYSGDYDHLARFGEWDESAPAVIERVT